MNTLILAAAILLSKAATPVAVEMTTAYKSHANHISAECVDGLVEEIQLAKFSQK